MTTNSTRRMAGFGFNTAEDEMKHGKYVFLSHINVSQLIVWMRGAFFRSQFCRLEAKVLEPLVGVTLASCRRFLAISLTVGLTHWTNVRPPMNDRAFQH